MSKHKKYALVYVVAIALLSLGGLVMKTDRNGIPHLTPQVINPETGEAIDMGDLVKHFRGD